MILALRNLPTDKVGDALQKLAANWDGQDRWYLEALGLALDNRENDYLSKLFDGSLYGDLGDLEVVGRNGNVALPPYFPVDRNEAFIAVGTPDLPVNALSKYLGLAWRVHKRAVLPVLERIAPHLRSPELQQAVDDILERMSEPETAELVADMAAQTPDPVHRRELLTIAGESACRGIGTLPTQNRRFLRSSSKLSRTPRASSRASRWRPRRATAGTARLSKHWPMMPRPPRRYESPPWRRSAPSTTPNGPRPADRLGSRQTQFELGRGSRGAGQFPALRCAGRFGQALDAADYPLGLRREALRTLMQQHDGGNRVFGLARARSFPMI